ncbi:hypothetical protein QBC36DRAFT_345504 [Triangularia setosa]|uniref:Aminoglycoside phosphotransferase domain-containing protein n=1 Tax=Triangularia setosa TaxID=2587417 RepID=A0AAN7A9I4_9PEZI|nr:hypothetical protein QBC36DRAFT_345504 [Podospora setosa]
MKLMEGTLAHGRWRTMLMEQKAELLGFGKVESLFRSIGTLDLREFAQGNDVEHLEKVAPGLLVTHEFFMGDRLLILLAQTAVLENTEDEDEREDAEEILLVAQKLLSFAPKTGLYHHDLHLNNILVNEDGEITAVLNWECASAMPLWMLTKVPKFLDEPAREEQPQRDLYGDGTPRDAAAAEGGRHDPGYLDNEGKNQLYFIHKRMAPQESYAEINFFQAIAQCDGIWVRKARRWADCMEKGKRIRFEDS